MLKWNPGMRDFAPKCVNKLALMRGFRQLVLPLVVFTCVGLPGMAQAGCAEQLLIVRGQIEDLYAEAGARLSEGQQVRLMEVLVSLCNAREPGESVTVVDDGDTRRKAFSTQGLNPQRTQHSEQQVAPIIGVEVERY